MFQFFGTPSTTKKLKNFLLFYMGKNGLVGIQLPTKAAITRCDLSPRFFCIDATLLCEFESDKV